MNKEYIIDRIFKINSEFLRYKDKDIDAMHYEVLHVLLTQIKGSFSSEWWENNMPESVKYVYSKLEKAIYFQTSYEYQMAKAKDIETGNDMLSGNSKQTKDMDRKVEHRTIGFAISDNNLEF